MAKTNTDDFAKRMAICDVEGPDADREPPPDRKDTVGRLRDITWEMADELIGGCHCDHAPPGETGVVRCVSCIVTGWRGRILQCIGELKNTGAW